MEMHSGTMVKTSGNFGFIKPDEPGVSDMFVMPPSCEAFGREVPPVGTRVMFSVVEDSRSGKPRADHVQPLDENVGNVVYDGATGWGEAPEAYAAQAQTTANVQYASHGQAQATEQTAVEVDLQSTAQALTQQLLADLPGLAHIDVAALGGVGAAQVVPEGQYSGMVQARSGSFGFIKQDSGDGDMFCLPPVHPVGTRVTYDIIADPKTGRPRADNVQLEGASASVQTNVQGYLEKLLAGGLFNAMLGQGAPAAGAGVAGAAAMAACTQGRGAGTMMSDRGAFGFITQDNGEPDMFTLPPLFPQGTRVTFDVMQDPKTGRPRAENVMDEQGMPAPAGLGSFGAALPKGKGGPRSAPYGDSAGKGGVPESQANEELVTGTVSKASEKFGFITQDSGESDMFLIPPACEAFGRQLPPVGTRVMYRVMIDQKTGKPRADNVQPTPEM